MKNIRIVFISDADDMYGAPKALLELVLSLKNQYNIEPIVCTCNYSNINRECEKYNIENHCTYHRSCMVDDYNKSLKKKIKDILRFFRYKVCQKLSVLLATKHIDFSTIDLIHSNSNRVDLGVLLSEKYKIPHIIHFREEAGGCKPFNKNIIYRMDRVSTSLVAISDIVKRGWIESGFTNEKFRVVYDGIDTSDVLVKDYSQTNEKFKIVCVGSLFENKGQHIIMKAIHKLNPTIRKNIILDIYGEGEYKKTLEKLKHTLNLENVFIKGYCENIHTILKDYDCGIVASKKEGFGRTTVEYMCASLCVIAANSGATVEIVKDGFNALVFDRENVDELANSIQELYNDKLLREKLATNGRKYVLENYTKEINARNIMRLYDEILIEQGVNDRQ